MFQEAVNSYPIAPTEISVQTEFVIPKFLRTLLLAIAVLVISIVVVGLLLYGVLGFFSMMHGASHYAPMTPMITGVGMP